MRSPNLHLSFALISSILGFGVSLALTPVMARIFAPSAYGGFAVANSIATIGATACLLSLPGALAIARSNTVRLRLTRLLIRLGLRGALLGLLVALAIHLWDEGDVRGDLTGWSFVATTPLLLLVTVVFRITAAWSIAMGEFRAQAEARIGYALTTRPLAILFGFLLGPQAWIMILSEIAAWIVQTALLLRGHGSAVARLWHRPKRTVSLRREWRANRTFTQFDYFSQMFLLLSASAPVLIVGSVYGAREAGLLSLSSSIVSIPVMLISLAISPAMLHEITQVWSRREQAAAVRLVRYFGLIALAALVGYALLAIIAPTLFPLFLGPQWIAAGPIAAVLCLPIGLMFVVQPFYAIVWHSGDAPAKLAIDACFSMLSLAVLLLARNAGFERALLMWVGVLTAHRLAELALVAVAARRLRGTLVRATTA